MNARPVRVFISYAHDPKVPGHKERALQLAESLRRRGVMAYIDQWVEHKSIFWPRWMADQVRDADFVLCLASPLYKERCEQLGDSATGRGARWEGALITHAMYADIISAPTKFITVLLDGTTPDDVPDVLMPYGYTYYRWVEGSEQDELLYRRITGQPLLKPPPLGPMVVYPT
jgi:TIR domain